MTSSISSQWRALWHTLTSNDRHAGPDVGYGSGPRMPIPQSQKKNSLTSTTDTSASDYINDHDLEAGNGFVSHNTGGTSSPIRRTLQRQSSQMEAMGSGEIQMQSFNDGLPPPPPVAHSWKRIDRWLEENYEELFENIGIGATINDVNELENLLDCTLPQEVRDSLQIHDGQERGGQPTGIVFGCMLLDCEEILQEWQQWRTVNEAFLTESRTYEIPQAPLKAFAGSSSAVPVAQVQQSGNPEWRSELLDKQDSQPANAVQRAYAHPAWIPLARDWGGNNIAVDLAPGPAGKWGQVILIGRDYDCKYVVSRSWSAFVATLADDMATDKWFIDEDTKELKLREFRQQGVEPAYIDILRWRSDQKYGRRMPKRRSLQIDPNAPPGSASGYSPYGSPTKDDRGRSPHRFSNGKAPAHGTSSPRGHVGSPLARVTEESTPVPTQPLKVDTTVAPANEKLISGVDTPATYKPTGIDKLVPVDSPTTMSSDEMRGERRGSGPFPRSRLGSTMISNDDDDETAPLSRDMRNSANLDGLEDDMKDVKI